MTPSSYSQAMEFLYALAAGAVCAFVYDFFRALRLNFKSRDSAVALEDLIFYVFLGAALVFVASRFTGGHFGYHFFFGAASGGLAYAIIFKNHVRDILAKLIALAGKMLRIIAAPFVFAAEKLRKLKRTVSAFAAKKCANIRKKIANKLPKRAKKRKKQKFFRKNVIKSLYKSKKML